MIAKPNLNPIYERIVPEPFMPIWVILVILVLIVSIIAIIGYLWIQKQKKKIIVLDPYATCLQALEALQKRDSIDLNSLSHIVQTYLSHRYPQLHPSDTIQEKLDKLPCTVHPYITDFFAAIELSRFSPITFDAHRQRQLLEQAFVVVQKLHND